MYNRFSFVIDKIKDIGCSIVILILVLCLILGVISMFYQCGRDLPSWVKGKVDSFKKDEKITIHETEKLDKKSEMMKQMLQQYYKGYNHDMQEAEYNRLREMLKAELEKQDEMIDGQEELVSLYRSALEMQIKGNTEAANHLDKVFCKELSRRMHTISFFVLCMSENILYGVDRVEFFTKESQRLTEFFPEEIYIDLEKLDEYDLSGMYLNVIYDDSIKDRVRRTVRLYYDGIINYYVLDKNVFMPSEPLTDGFRRIEPEPVYPIEPVETHSERMYRTLNSLQKALSNYNSGEYRDSLSDLMSVYRDASCIRNVSRLRRL